MGRGLHRAVCLPAYPYESAFNECQEKMREGISEQELQKYSELLAHAIDLKDTF
jgi:hypothetical protein